MPSLYVWIMLVGRARSIIAAAITRDAAVQFKRKWGRCLRRPI
jgi:hypothetical protein